MAVKVVIEISIESHRACCEREVDMIFIAGSNEEKMSVSMKGLYL